ncbi:MAG: sigma-70 family RNA polymerase sigma factor [Anaerolineae bacterium]|nr:sigma-70 family RNA polymerase sigma factor [Anaerolineae bacterium]
MTTLTLLDTDTPLLAECEAVARRVVANQGWALVGAWDAFVAEVARSVADGPAGRVGDSLEKRIERAVTRAYCPILYAACRQRHGPRCVRAFEELGRYLHAVALRRTSDGEAAAEAAQRALEIVYAHLDDVREPWAFLGYARVILVRELKPPRRRGKLLQFVPLRGDDPQEPGVQPADPQADAGRADVERSMDDQALRDAIRRCLRSKQQRETILRLFLDEQSVVQVADALGTTPANVWVLKSRALDRLRQCPDVARLLVD